MEDFDSTNECVYQCNKHKLEAPHGLLLSLQNCLVNVVNPKTVGRGGGSPINPQQLSHRQLDALWLLITSTCQ